MAINWFEGGRRISALLSGLVLLGGAAYAVFSGVDNRVIVETTSPGEAFHWTLKDCAYPDQEKTWDGQVEFEIGDPRTVAACFRANKSGKLWYDYGPEQQVQLDPIKGKGPPPAIKYRKMLEVDAYTPVADAYMARRMNEYKPTRAEFDAIGKNQWMIAWVRFSDRVKEATPWVAGLLFGIWLFSAMIGWIIRGFAGIPSGKDFRADRPEHGNARRACGEWIGVAIAGTIIVGVIAWGIGAAMSAAASTIGRVVSKVFGAIGTLISVVLFFGAAAAGGWGLWVLGHKILRRQVSELTEKKLLAVCIANVALVTGASYPANAYTIIGTWVDAVDSWSRSNGYADGGSMFVFSLCLLWPLMPLAIMHKLKGASYNVPSASTE
ncbi:MAG TPA: hypothetical protein VJM09_02570 [Sphingobium sp.]|nr:hypothetical protein [Sphingobium sp.]